MHSKTQSFFDDIRDQNIIGVTSSFTRSEFLEVARDILAERINSIPTPQQITQIISTFDDFTRNLGIVYYDSDDLVDDTFFQNVHQQIIQSSPVRDGGRWKSIGGCDSILLCFAEKSNCNQIATNDGGFKGTNSSVTPLIVRENY